MNLAAKVGKQEEGAAAEKLRIVGMGHEGEYNWSGHGTIVEDLGRVSMATVCFSLLIHPGEK
jgi:hypothetical protein